MIDQVRVLVAMLGILACGCEPLLAAVKPVVTNKSRFRIPFRFDAAALQRMNARELQLFVSANRGASWDLSQSIGTQSAKFEFHAPTDGEYWFAVRTIDGAGNAHPPGPRLEAGLVVIVDSIAPSLAINLEQPEAGKITLTWSASDPNLDPTTLRLEYLQPGQSVWEAVSVVPTQRGMTNWTVPAAGRVAVRGSISDLAGNMGQTSSHLDASASRVQPSRDKPDLRHPIATEPTPELFSQRPELPAIVTPEIAVASPRNPTSEAPTSTPRLSAPNETSAVVSRIPGSKSPVGSTMPLVSNDGDRLPAVVQDRWPAATAPVDEPVVSRSNSRQRVVNTRRFQLGYKVDDVGPSGVGGVDMFITPDRGRQWYRYGEDPDRTSPFEIEVPRDGEYGFTVRVRSGAGLSMDPPQPGEPPSILVTVDQTAPVVELLPVRQGRGPDLNKITIAWRVQEDRPADKPVSLYYGIGPQGPWEPISGWLPDTGSHTWTVGAGAPARFYIRIVARDAAGNTSQVETGDPVVVDLTRPSARIVDVDVITQEAPK